VKSAAMLVFWVAVLAKPPADIMSASSISSHATDWGTSRVEHLEENITAAELRIDANKMQELNRMARAGYLIGRDPVMRMSTSLLARASPPPDPVDILSIGII
jgi:hypothetical protein